MDDNSGESPKNQSGPVFESVPVDEVPQALPPDEAQVVPPLDTAGDAFLNAPPPELTGGTAPPLYEESKSKYFVIAGIAIFFVVIFGAILAAFLSMRGGGEQKTPDPVTLTYWGLWEDPKVMQPIIDDYKKLNPHVTVKYELQSPMEYRQKLIQRGRNNLGPDIYRFHNTWLPEIRDVAAALPKEIMTNDEFDKTFYPIHQRDLKIENDYYGIPLSVDGLLMVYNDNLFSKAGITTPPTSWISDFYEVVTQLTVQDRDSTIVTSGAAIGTANNIDHFSDLYGTLLLQNGGDITTIDSKEAAEALQFYREFAEKNIWNEAMPNNVEAFAQEKVAIVFIPSWQILRVKSLNPDLTIKVAPVPKSPNNKSLTLATYWVEGVSKFSPNQAEAWKFLKYMSTKEVQLKMLELQTKSRGLGTAPSRVDLQDQVTQDPILNVVLQQADTYQSLPIADRTFDKGLNDDNIIYLKNAVNATAAGTSYQEALKTAKEGITTVLNRYTGNPTPASP